MSRSPIALCVGHSRRIQGRTEGGAISVSGVSEHAFNSDLARRIRALLEARSIPAFVVTEYEGVGYGSAQAWLARHLEERGAGLALELHFNAATGAARGHEWLHWASSARSERLATSLHAAVAAAFPELPDRGVQAKDRGDRGAEFLRGTHCPAVICEPFFGDNPFDWQVATTRTQDLAAAIAAGLAAYLA